MTSCARSQHTHTAPLFPPPTPPAGITFISVGHRPTLTQFHERVLLLHGAGSGLDAADAAPGGWEVRPASEMSLERAMDYMG